MPDSPTDKGVNISGRSMDRVVARKMPLSTEARLRRRGRRGAAVRVVAGRHAAGRAQPERQLAADHRLEGHGRHLRGLHPAARPAGTEQHRLPRRRSPAAASRKSWSRTAPWSKPASRSRACPTPTCSSRSSAARRPSTEQLNDMRTLELQLEQNRLSHKRDLVEINYQVKRLTRAVARQRELARQEARARSRRSTTCRTNSTTTSTSATSRSRARRPMPACRRPSSHS